MKANTPSRRGFLRGTGLVAMGLATGGTIILAPDCTWALSTTAIDVHTAQTLLVMARQIVPARPPWRSVLRQRGRRSRQAGGG